MSHKKQIILKLINSLEDNYFLYGNKPIKIRLNFNKTEIDIIGKDSDDSDEVLQGIFINKDVLIIVGNKGISINNEYLCYDC